MSKKEVIAVFDIGKTNKKFFLFDAHLKILFRQEQKFETILDDDGFECDDIELIEIWIHTTLKIYSSSKEYEVVGVNFSAYGATLVFLNKDGKRLTPIYNYLKEVSPEIKLNLFNKYGGEDDFCRKTGSPALGALLNSGVQILWLKIEHPEIFKNVTDIIHFPQYLSYLLTQQIVSDSTSIGCHTFLWDFDGNKYHDWLQLEGIILPNPIPNSHTFNIKINGKGVHFGIGIHDSSSSLIPYQQGSSERFLLISTGTWCININPFNHKPLTQAQLRSDCLSYLSVDQQTVKASRLFMGYIHNINTQRLCTVFDVPADSFKTVKINEFLLNEFFININYEHKFFSDGVPEGYLDEKIDLSMFTDFSEAYHRLMFDLTLLNSKSINLILSEQDEIRNLYISGGFTKNEIFVRLLASFYPNYNVFTSEVDNASALGAAMVIRDAFSCVDKPTIDLGLKKWKAI